MPENTLFSYRLENDSDEPGTSQWWQSNGERVTIEKDCLGRNMLSEKGAGWPNLTLVASAWSDRGLFFHFDCWSGGSHQGQDTVVLVIQPESVGTSVKLEIDSQGRCVDAHVLRAGVDIDLKWDSRAEIKIGPGEKGFSRQLQVALPLHHLLLLWSEAPPEEGSVWRLNLARIIEMEQETEYLLWRPGFSTYANVLDPAAFGNLMFLDA